MDTTEALARAEEITRPYAQGVNRPAPDRLDVTILPADLEAVARALTAQKWGHLSAITGVDRPAKPAPAGDPAEAAATEPEGAIEILYHFCRKAAICTLRTSVSYASPEIHTVCDILPAATLYERELVEMFGVKVIGTPNPDRLLLPEDWPDGVYPLRKSFKGLQPASSPSKEA